jgi:glycosyltransferase involved in cell wall biosynthesis
VITGRNVIIISSIAWDFLWQGPQEIAMRLARAGNRVLYLDNIGLRAPGLRDHRRVREHVGKWVRYAGTQVREIESGLYVCTPVVLPPFGTALQRWLNRRFFLPRIAAQARALGLDDPIIISYLPTDTAVALIAMLATPRSVVAAYYATDHVRFVTHQERLARWEPLFLRAADVVFAQESILAAHAARFNGNVHVAPHGVSVEAFENGGEPGPELAAIPPPVIGYIGGLHVAVDYDLLREAVRLRPEWSWVFIGSIQVARSLLPRAANVHYLGPHPHAELPRLIRRFDVCIIPYRQDPSTDVVLPTKLGEYLAAGKPVVSTRLSTVVELNRKHPVLVISDDSAESFVNAIETALALPAGEATIQRRRDVAALDDWRLRMEQISRHLEEAAARKKS